MPIEEWQKTHKSKVPPSNALGKDLQFPAEEELRGRKVWVLVIDEGQEIAQVTSHRILSNQVQFLKTRGKTTNVRQLLAGTYELKILCNLNGQLSRISREVYFPAYQKTAEGFEMFVKLVVRLQRHLPLEIMPDLKKESEYLFEGSLGRAGILKDWLHDTLADVLDRGGKTITKADLKRNALSEDKLNELRAEVKGTDSEYLEGLSSGKAEPAEQHDVGKPDKAKEAARSNSATTAKRNGRRGRRVGDRNPKRDPVGRD
jgi:hypothetical protein